MKECSNECPRAENENNLITGCPDKLFVAFGKPYKCLYTAVRDFHMERETE